MVFVTVQGGTNAGTKRPLKEPRPGWVCVRAHANPGYATRCLTEGCGERRDELPARVFADGLAWCGHCRRAVDRGWDHAPGCPKA